MKKLFGESARYRNDDVYEKDEAKQYLISWKKFLMRRFESDGCEAVIISEEWVHRDACLDGALCPFDRMGLKLEIDMNFKYELK